MPEPNLANDAWESLLTAQRRSDCLSASVRESPKFLKNGLSIRFKGA